MRGFYIRGFTLLPFKLKGRVFFIYRGGGNTGLYYRFRLKAWPYSYR